ncbi:MAG: hypothetical protein AABX40_01660 [Candidatus Hydrothermarchaeota archaeon]
MISLAGLSLFVFLINLPFGYWRSKTVRFSRQWMLAIHLPIPLIFVLRTVSGIGLRYVPILAIFFALGQFTGARVGKSLQGLGKNL